MTPFLYVRRHHTVDPGPDGVHFYSAYVMAANMGYGHKHDPCMREFKGYKDRLAMETALERWVKTLDPSVQVCLAEEDYLAMMAESNVAHAAAKEGTLGVV